MQALAGVPREGLVPGLSLAAAAFCLHCSWQQKRVSTFKVSPFAAQKRSRASSHYCGAAAPRSNKRCSAFNCCLSNRVGCVMTRGVCLGKDCPKPEQEMPLGAVGQRKKDLEL